MSFVYLATLIVGAGLAIAFEPRGGKINTGAYLGGVFMTAGGVTGLFMLAAGFSG